MKFLLDSVICIDHFNGIDAATDFIRGEKESSLISVITRAEVLTGFGDDIPRDVFALLDALPHLPIERETADHAALLRQRYHWKLPDAFQAALALQYDCKLVTRNTKDFDPERHGFVIVPYRT
uniref:PIN domain-containing protein n=1 Tax=Candidatus Kentrum sp. FW TaxID=2126338 RepID=A0A450TIT9_9GAMM|nr:MAG: hypothetical protein BECKFW1821C_GA0114237_101142 [Candidatus Kentron sp. FW]